MVMYLLADDPRIVSVVTRFDVPMVTDGDGDRSAGRQRETPSEVNADGVVT
jgi:hypothetical protein